MYDPALVKEIYFNFVKWGGWKSSTWGAHAWHMVTPDTLQFKVEGKLFKGYVRIRPNNTWGLFNIHYGRIYHGLWWSSKSQHGVPLRRIAHLIHRQIEDRGKE